MGKRQPLTERQTDILRLIALGYSSSQISQRLRITQKTVDTHRNRLYRKLELQGTVEAVWHAISIGLVSMADYFQARAFRSTRVARTQDRARERRPISPQAEERRAPYSRRNK
jgi:DNA-binding CsgD family transcriptional regulator